jgi:CubicO group peptidase (beta-lactamase class C family)
MKKKTGFWGWIGRGLLFLLALMIIVPLGVYLSDRVYWNRYVGLAQQAASGQGLDYYDTLETVEGASFAPLPVKTAETRTIPTTALKTADEYVTPMKTQALLVWRKGGLEHATYFGGADAATLINSKSMAKPMTAIAIGRAIALGKIASLDDPVAKYVPEWKGTPKEKMLVRHLLDMRTGLKPQEFTISPFSILNRAYLHPEHERIIIHDYPLTHEPGSRYEYSNVTSELVALVIERATGRRYGEFLGDEVLKPIGAAGGKIWVGKPGGLAHAGCCLLLPAESWLRLGILLLQDGAWNGVRLLPEGYVTAMRTPTAQNPYYGLGVYVAGRYIERRGFLNPENDLGKSLHSEPYLADDLYLWDGNANQVQYIIPSQDLVILRVGAVPPKPPAPEWDNAFLPNTILAALATQPGEKPSSPQPR